MANKIVGALIVVIIFLSAVTVSIIAYPKPKIDESSDTTVTTPTPQPTNSESTTQSTPIPQPIIQPKIQTYTGYLVSFNYETSQTNGVESTQLVFTNKTFNYAGYIPLENNCVYNVTYYDDNPNQALSITRTEIDSTIGLIGNAEQMSITNVQIAAGTPGIATFTVLNSGSGSVTLTNAATIDGSPANLALGIGISSFTIAKGATGTYTLTGNFVSGYQYDFKLTTAKGTGIVYTATCP